MKRIRPRTLALILWLLACPWLLFPSVSAPATALAAALLLLIPFLLRRECGRYLPATLFDSYILVLLGFTTTSFLISPLPEVSLPKLLVILLGALAFYLLQAWLNSPARLEQLFVLLALAGVAITVVGLFTLKWPERQILNLPAIEALLPHLSGPFYLHHNEMAGTLLPLLPFAVALWGRHPRPVSGWWRLLAGVASLSILLGLIISQSRSALLGIVAAGIASLIWSRLRPRRLVLWGTLPFLLLSLWSLQPGSQLSTVSQWIAQVDVTSKTGSSDAASWVTRLEIWAAATQMLQDYPVLGAGLYTFEPISRANYPYELIGPEFVIAHAHNLFLQAGASGGWPGLLALVALWITVLGRLWIAGHHPNPALRRYAMLFGAAVVAYLSFNLLDALTLGQKPGVLIWIILAGSAAVVRQAEVPELPLLYRDGKSHLAAAYFRYAPLAPLLLLGILSLTPALPRNLASLQLDRLRLTDVATPLPDPTALAGDPRRLGLLALTQGDRAAALEYWRDDPAASLFLGSQGRQAVYVGHPEAALAWYDLALAVSPTDATAYFWRGAALETTGKSALAFADYSSAVRYAGANQLSKMWQARIVYSWGRLLLARGEIGAALEAFQQAVELQPEVAWYYQALGDALVASGDEAAAETAYREAAARR